MFSRPKGDTVLSTGVNHTRFHAEHDALRKLPPLFNGNQRRGRGRRRNIDLIVVRFSGEKRLQSSKPCAHCISFMNSDFVCRRGYCIRNVYYSDSTGEIRNDTLVKLTNEEKKHISRKYRHVF